ncbi:hypothetical protein AOXY_G22010 [Acipenser oxyrinchus oxyrinchus]|uniref:Uncharacterized protein n=1 Tax=Acipenser oxyrinchus oxyrinchus TaxID=40147 RepID=A0AAD8G189_ACIOX|nr:hypothetical protein AOXY_G22010 [Acipenser oxyrinchus oxyrinchus]
MPFLKDLLAKVCGIVSSTNYSHPLPVEFDSLCTNFHPKKAPRRQTTSLSTLYILDYSSRAGELGLEPGPPALNLSGMKLTFKNGKWISEGGERPSKSKRALRNLKQKNRVLEEENNYLRVRTELLVDMLAESTAHLQLLEDEVEREAFRDTRRRQSVRRVSNVTASNIPEPMLGAESSEAHKELGRTSIPTTTNTTTEPMLIPDNEEGKKKSHRSSEPSTSTATAQLRTFPETRKEKKAVRRASTPPGFSTVEPISGRPYVL